MAHNDVAKAYPFRALDAEPVVNDEVGEEPIVVIFDQDSATGVVFGRKADDRILSFALRTAGGLNDMRLVDEETRTVWSAFTGQAVEGQLAGAQLQRIKSTSSFWFGWKDFYPETEIYGLTD